MVATPMTVEEKLKYLMDQIVWAATHRGLVPDDGIFEVLVDAVEVCKESVTKLKKD